MVNKLQPQTISNCFYFTRHVFLLFSFILFLFILFFLSASLPFFPYLPHDNSINFTPQQFFFHPTSTTFLSLIKFLICFLLCQQLCLIKPTLGFPYSAMTEASWSIFPFGQAATSLLFIGSMTGDKWLVITRPLAWERQNLSTISSAPFHQFSSSLVAAN